MFTFNLPDKCKIDKNLPKEIIYKNAEADEKFKRIFINNVEKIRYEYSLTYENSNIKKYTENGEKYEEIHFIRITLKEKGKENIICKLLHQLIPKATVFILEYKEQIFISSAIKKIGNNKINIEEIYNTDWVNKNSEKLKNLDYSNLNSTNLKFFYENIIEKIRVIKLSKNFRNIEKKNIDLIELLNKEIEELKILRKKETQINRIVEIQAKLLDKIKERDIVLKKDEK